MDLSAAIHQWKSLLGESNVHIGAAVSALYATDTGGSHRDIPAALRIENSANLPDIMRIADRCRVPVYPISTGNNWGYGSALPVRDGCVILDLSPLQKILDFDAEMGVVTIEPGVTQQMLADFLDTGNYPYLVPVTGAGPSCSLLGNALERGYGITPHVDHFAAVTDLEAVLPDGSLYRTALREVAGDDLARLFKWGIGPYSTGLFTQAGMGIVTSMSIILSRRPECIKACFFGLRHDEQLEPAVRAIRSLLTMLPGTLGAVNLMNRHRVLSMSAPFPSSQLGPNGLIPQDIIQRMGQQHQVMPWTGFASLYGTPRTVAAAQKEIENTLSKTASRIIFLTPSRTKTLSKLVQWIPGTTGKRLVAIADTLTRSLELVAGRPNQTALALAYWRNLNAPKSELKNPAHDGCGLIWYSPLVPMRPTGVRAYVDMVKGLTHKHGMEPLITLTSISDKLFDSTVPLLFARNHPPSVIDAKACYFDLLKTGLAQGWFPYRVGVDAMHFLSGLQSNSKTFHDRLRKDLDPYDLMAPGRYR